MDDDDGIGLTLWCANLD